MQENYQGYDIQVNEINQAVHQAIAMNAEGDRILSVSTTHGELNALKGAKNRIFAMGMQTSTDMKSIYWLGNEEKFNKRRKKAKMGRKTRKNNR